MNVARTLLSGICLAMAVATASWPMAAAKGDVRKPNIILILADDLGYGDLGCYGQKLIETPHLDRMAAEGMRFTQFYAGSTVCALPLMICSLGRRASAPCSGTKPARKARATTPAKQRSAPVNWFENLNRICALRISFTPINYLPARLSQTMFTSFFCLGPGVLRPSVT